MRYSRPSGHKRVRRLRLAMKTDGDIVVVRRKNRRPMPSNWRELIAEAVPSAAEARASEERSRKGASAQPSAFVQPDVMIPRLYQASKPWSMAFGICRANVGTTGYGRMFATRMAVDRAIEEVDVRFIPFIGQPKLLVRNGQLYLQTDLRARDTYTGHGRSSLVPTELRGIPGLNHNHIRVYTTNRGKLGLSTKCPVTSDCDCKNILPQIWERAWRM